MSLAWGSWRGSVMAIPEQVDAVNPKRMPDQGCSGKESSAFQRTDRERSLFSDSSRPGLSGADRFPRHPETNGKPALSQGELFADASIFFGAHASSELISMRTMCAFQSPRNSPESWSYFPSAGSR
jgi:hypothetical protein